MIKNEIERFSRNLQPINEVVLDDMRNSVRRGLGIDTKTQRGGVFCETVSRTYYYASEFLGIPPAKFELGSGIDSKGKRYLAAADVTPEKIGVITFNSDYVRSRVLDLKVVANNTELCGYMANQPTAIVTAHEAYHIRQLLVAPKRVRRLANTADSEEWSNSTADRAAQIFAELFVNNMRINNRTDIAIFSGAKRINILDMFMDPKVAHELTKIK